MKLRTAFQFGILFVALLSLGCSGGREKGRNQDKDRPGIATPPTPSKS
jgi:hypothetical protein